MGTIEQMAFVARNLVGKELPYRMFIQDNSLDLRRGHEHGSRPMAKIRRRCSRARILGILVGLPSAVLSCLLLYDRWAPSGEDPIIMNTYLVAAGPFLFASAALFVTGTLLCIALQLRRQKQLVTPRLQRQEAARQRREKQYQREEDAKLRQQIMGAMEEVIPLVLQYSASPEGVMMPRDHGRMLALMEDLINAGLLLEGDQHLEPTELWVRLDYLRPILERHGVDRAREEAQRLNQRRLEDTP